MYVSNVHLAVWMLEVPNVKTGQPENRVLSVSRSLSGKEDKVKGAAHGPVNTGHTHRWRIEEAQGRYSKGVCSGCGAEKQFKNWISDLDFITNFEHREIYRVV